MIDFIPRRLGIAALALVLLFGTFVRIYPTTKIQGMGFDENYYCRYLSVFTQLGIGNYSQLTKAYVEAQAEMSQAVIPPTRFLYLFPAYLIHQLSSADIYKSLRAASCLFTILSLAVTALFIMRAAGLGAAVGVTAMMACAPLQIQMAQRVYVDGVFVFWALLSLWTLWGNLRAPNHLGWLAVYAVSLAGMVLTKENAAFVFMALCGIIILNRWTKIGTVTPKLLVTTVIGPALGAIALILLCGGPEICFQVYRINVQMSAYLPYAIATGDGSWHRYLVDLVIMSPAVMLLAIGGVFQTAANKLSLYLLLFIVVTYAVMANIKYGMNLRYGTIWDMPLRWLAFSQLAALCSYFANKRLGTYALIAGTMLVCALELRQYSIFFMKHGIYDPVTSPMLQSLDIIKQ